MCPPFPPSFSSLSTPPILFFFPPDSLPRNLRRLPKSTLVSYSLLPVQMVCPVSFQGVLFVSPTPPPRRSETLVALLFLFFDTGVLPPLVVNRKVQTFFSRFYWFLSFFLFRAIRTPKQPTRLPFFPPFFLSKPFFPPALPPRKPLP